MKSLYKYLIFVILSINYSFKTFAKTNNKNKTIVLSGKIKNYKKKSIKLQGFKFEKRIKFNKKTESFSISLENLKKGNYRILIRKKVINIYLDAKNDLFIETDRKRFSPPIFKGDKKLVSINNYLQNKEIAFHKILSSAHDLFENKEDIFITKMNTYKDHLIVLLKKSKTPRSFRKIEKKNILYTYLRNFQNYENYYRVITGNEEFKASQKILNKLKNYSLNNEKLYVFSQSYRAFISENIEYDISKKLKKKINYSLETSLDLINKKISNNFIKDELLYKNALNDIYKYQDLFLYYKTFISYNSTNSYKDSITKLYHKFKPIQKGQPSPKFKDYQNFNGTKTSLDDLLNKGNYIYIYFWASWCGFCKQEIQNPLIQNFSEIYKDANITFVGINVEENYNKWKKYVNTYEMYQNQNQLFSGKYFEYLDFAKKYLVQGLPRFILLAPDGTIIHNNAPRPSKSDKLHEFFNKNNIKKSLLSDKRQQ